MKHKSFVVTSTVVMFILIGVVAGLALYSSMVVSASIRDLPESIAYLPKDSQAVFGMNVKSFIASPAYATFQQKHGDQVGKDLADFIAQTGVDPRNDISYVIASGRSLEGKKGTGVVIAQGNFNTAAITTFINSKAAPIKLDYNGATVLIIPEANGSTVEKGIAFLREQEITLGEM